MLVLRCSVSSHGVGAGREDRQRGGRPTANNESCGTGPMRAQAARPSAAMRE